MTGSVRRTQRRLTTRHAEQILKDIGSDLIAEIRSEHTRLNVASPANRAALIESSTTMEARTSSLSL